MERAKLVEIRFDDKGKPQDMPKGEGKQVDVQFNPETLKVTFANQLQTPKTSNDNSAGPAGRQYVGAGTTKLSLMLWFDVTSPTSDAQRVDDVRRLTQDVIYFMTPKEPTSEATQFAPPGVRFVWGSFKFDGIMESLEESLEFFSPEGKPLRASVSVNLAQQEILKTKFDGSGRLPGQGAARGTQPLAAASAGATLQGMAEAVSRGLDWQLIAQANGIENPRMLAPGQLIDLNVRLSRG
jgi:hypothetical protein